MKPQLILAVKESTIAPFVNAHYGVHPMDAIDITTKLQESGLFLGPRDMLEKMPSFLQIIPYVVVKQGDKYVKYTRTEKGGESELHDKVSIGAGGHIDLKDVCSLRDSTVSLAVTINLSMLRELEEELGLTYGKDYPGADWRGLLVDFSDPVGRVHIGVVIVVELEPTSVVEAKEDALADVKLATLDELETDRPNMEKWSAHVLDYLKAVQPGLCSTFE